MADTITSKQSFYPGASSTADFALHSASTAVVSSTLARCAIIIVVCPFDTGIIGLYKL